MIQLHAQSHALVGGVQMQHTYLDLLSIAKELARRLVRVERHSEAWINPSTPASMRANAP
jgi:hypothetical protein